MLVSWLVAIQWWREYFLLDRVSDGRHDIIFHGASAYGHLIGVTLGVIATTVIAGRSIWRFVSERSPDAGLKGRNPGATLE